MPTISTTTLEDLEPLLVEVIEAIVPRVTNRGSQRWKHYEKGKISAAGTRQFTLRWAPGPFKPGGYFTNSDVEQAAILTVRVDYSGQHETNMWLIQDDYAQLRDRMNILTADISTGLVSILRTPVPPSVAGDTGQGRARLSDRAASNTDTIQIDHQFAVTYMQARATA